MTRYRRRRYLPLVPLQLEGVDEMNGFLDFAYAAKAWVAGLVAAVGAVVAAVKLAVVDEAISFDEAEGIWLLVIQAVTVLASAVAVFKKRNAST